MTEQRGGPEVPEAAETGSAPQPLDFPGADSAPPGRPDGDQDPDDADRDPGDPRP